MTAVQPAKTRQRGAEGSGEASVSQPLDVLATCARVHGAYTGSAPDISDEALRDAVAALRVRLAEWAPSCGRGIEYDAVVHELVRVAISEGERELRAGALRASVRL